MTFIEAARTSADLIEHNGQYQWNPASSDHEMLFNGRREPLIKMLKLDGLLGLPELGKADNVKQASDGGIAGTPYYGLRVLTGDIALMAHDPWEMHQLIMDLTESMLAEEDDDDGVFVYQKARVGKRLVYARPRRLSIPSVAEVINANMAKGTIEWECYDPRIYAFNQQQIEIILNPGETVKQGTVYMGGNWRRGSPCIVEVTGPGDDIIVANDDDFNRQIRFNAPIAGNETLILHTGKLTVTDQGTGDSRVSKLSRDNQWWELKKGENTITVTRSSAAGTMHVKVYWRDAFTL